MLTDALSQLESDIWWALPWPHPDASWRACRSSLGLQLLESPALLAQPDSGSCLRALQLGLIAPWQLPGRLVLRQQALHLQVAWDLTQRPDSLAEGLLADLAETGERLATWAQEVPEPDCDDAPTPDSQALQAMGDVLALLEQDPELGPLCELDEDSAELSIGGGEDANWLILLRPLPSGQQPLRIAMLLPQALLPTDEPARLQALQRHLSRNDALQIGPELHWVADASGQQVFLQTLLQPGCSLAQLRLQLARMLAIDAECLAEGDTPFAAASDLPQLFPSGVRA